MYELRQNHKYRYLNIGRPSTVLKLRIFLFILDESDIRPKVTKNLI